MTRTALRALSLQNHSCKSPYEGRTHLRERGRKMPSTALLQKRKASHAKTLKNLSYDKTLID